MRRAYQYWRPVEILIHTPDEVARHGARLPVQPRAHHPHADVDVLEQPARTAVDKYLHAVRRPRQHPIALADRDTVELRDLVVLKRARTQRHHEKYLALKPILL